MERLVNVDPAEMTTNVDELMDRMDLSSHPPESVPDNLLCGIGLKSKSLLARQKGLRPDAVRFYHKIGTAGRSGHTSAERAAGPHHEYAEDSLPHYGPELQSITRLAEAKRALKINCVPSSVNQVGGVLAENRQIDTQPKHRDSKGPRRNQHDFLIRKRAPRLVRKSVPSLQHRKYEVHVAPPREPIATHIWKVD